MCSAFRQPACEAPQPACLNRGNTLLQKALDIVKRLAECTRSYHEAALLLHALVDEIHRTQLQRLVVSIIYGRRIHEHLRYVLLYFGQQQTSVALALSLSFFGQGILQILRDGDIANLHGHHGDRVSP